MLYWLFTAWNHVLLAVQKSCAGACIMGRRVGANGRHMQIETVLCWKIHAPHMWFLGVSETFAYSSSIIWPSVWMEMDWNEFLLENLITGSGVIFIYTSSIIWSYVFGEMYIRSWYSLYLRTFEECPAGKPHRAFRAVQCRITDV